MSAVTSPPNLNAAEPAADDVRGLLTLRPKDVYEAIDASDSRLSKARKLRTEALREFTGRYYNEDHGKNRPMNIVYRACRVLRAHIAYQSPKYTVTSDNQAVRGEATVLGDKLTHLADELGFRHLDKLAMLDAMLGPCAIVRMGIRVSSELETMEGRDLNPGQWYIRRISLDDYVCDPRANRREEMAWEGDRYRVSKERLLASGKFDTETVKRIPNMPRRSKSSDDRADSVSGGGKDQAFDLIDTIELIDVFFYDLGGSGKTVKVTLPVEFESDEWLVVEEYQGPERGPYEMLEFDPLPDNPIALAPVSAFREQSENLNNVLSKLLEQVSKSKRVPVVGDQLPTDTIDQLREAEDGEIWKTPDPSAAKVLDMSFVSPELIPLGQMFMQHANTMAGNPDMLGGTGSNAQTATEFQGMMTTAGVMVDSMIADHDQFWGRVGRHALWYLTRDPFIQFGSVQRIPGGWNVPVQYTAEQREGDFEDFALKVIPGSTVRMDENVKGKRMMELAAMVPQLVQTEMLTQGGFSAMGTLRVLGRRFGEDELDEMIPDPGLIQEAARRMQGIPGITQGTPRGMGGGQQTRAIDTVRSAAGAATGAMR